MLFSLDNVLQGWKCSNSLFTYCKYNEKLSLTILSALLEQRNPKHNNGFIRSTSTVYRAGCCHHHRSSCFRADPGFTTTTRQGNQETCRYQRDTRTRLTTRGLFSSIIFIKPPNTRMGHAELPKWRSHTRMDDSKVYAKRRQHTRMDDTAAPQRCSDARCILVATPNGHGSRIP